MSHGGMAGMDFAGGHRMGSLASAFAGLVSGSGAGMMPGMATENVSSRSRKPHVWWVNDVPPLGLLFRPCLCLPSPFRPTHSRIRPYGHSAFVAQCAIARRINGRTSPDGSVQDRFAARVARRIVKTAACLGTDA